LRRRSCNCCGIFSAISRCRRHRQWCFALAMGLTDITITRPTYNRMKKCILLFLLVSSCLMGYAQFQENTPAPKPIAPNAASLFKVLDCPLGTFTGTIPISFPLCRVTSGPLSADVALNYTSTGGIKVEELASCVGLGFHLADGAGRITQMVRG